MFVVLFGDIIEIRILNISHKVYLIGGDIYGIYNFSE